MKRSLTRLVSGVLLATAGWCAIVLGTTALAQTSTLHRGAPHSRQVEFSPSVALGDRFMGIRLLGFLALRRFDFNGIPIVELSGLAWDEDEGLLYAVSDQGALIHMRPSFDDGMLSAIQIQAAHRLRGPNEQALHGEWADSEGLVAVNADDGKHGNTQLAVSFERKPRVQLFDTTGHSKRPVAIAPAHQQIRNFRSSNRALEALARHPSFGWLTGPERPLKGQSRYDLRDVNARVWPLAPHPAKNASLVAMEAMDDGGLLTLERGFNLSALTVIIALRRTEPLTRNNVGHPLASELIAVLDSRGDVMVDNFEGLTRHRDDRYFIVADDNESFLQMTFLLYFSLEPR